MPTYIPISSEHHIEKRWKRHASIEFAKSDNVVPIYINELPEIIHYLPVAFVQNENSFILVAAMGLRASENLLVTGDNRWIGGYVPATYRFKPFKLLGNGNGNDKFICIEEEQISNDDSGDVFFAEDGKINGVIFEIMNVINHYESSSFLAKNIVETLVKYELLTPWNIMIGEGESEQAFTGLFQVNEQALNQLSDNDFIEVKKSGALSVIYAQLLSMNCIENLKNLLRLRIQEESRKIDSGDTFSFLGI